MRGCARIAARSSASCWRLRRRDALAEALRLNRRTLALFKTALEARSTAEQDKIFAELDFSALLGTFPIWATTNPHAAEMHAARPRDVRSGHRRRGVAVRRGQRAAAALSRQARHRLRRPQAVAPPLVAARGPSGGARLAARPLGQPALAVELPHAQPAGCGERRAALAGRRGAARRALPQPAADHRVQQPPLLRPGACA